MKMLMIVVEDSKKEELEVFLERSGVHGYTEVSHAAGIGSSEPRLGSSAFPRTSAVVFSVLSEEALERLLRAVEEFCSDCGADLQMVAWEVDVLRGLGSPTAA